jgi:hypothetical protein
MVDQNQEAQLELGQSISTAFEYIQAVYEETRHLIDILDDLVAPEWKPPSSSYVTTGLSQSLQSPTKWLVKKLFRNYHRTDEPDARVGITIAYLHPRIDEPILIGGRIDYPPDQIAGPDDPSHRWDLRKAWFERGPEEKKADGTLYSVRFDEADSKDGEAEARVFAIPLVGIQSEDDIQTKVYDKLMRP